MLETAVFGVLPEEPLTHSFMFAIFSDCGSGGLQKTQWDWQCRGHPPNAPAIEASNLLSNTRKERVVTYGDMV